MNNQQAINLLKNLEQSLDDYCELNDEGKTAFRMAITALELFGNSEQLPSAQPEPCGDVVSRNAIIQKLNTMDRYVSEELRLCDTDKKFPQNEVFIVDDVYEEIVENLPSAQPETHDKRTETHSCDLISRQAAVEAIENTDWYHLRDGVMVRGANSKEHQAWYKEQDVYKTLEQLPSAQQRWIPCSERLPDEYGEYRITWVTSCAPSKRFIGDSEYEVTSVWDEERKDFKGEWLLDDYIKHYPDVKVIAWKPLEEPYREEGD